MKTIPRLAAAVMAIAVLFCGCAFLNDYEEEGELSLSGLKEPVTVLRDERGVAYVRASGLDDALMAQGFLSAQDRLFQMELNRRFAAGRISEFAGEKALGIDIRMRTIGIYRAAQKHALLLDAPTRAFFERYAAGVNAYIKACKDTYPLEFKLAGITPELWSVADSLSILYLMAWNTSANIHTELAMQALAEAVGSEKARELLPINVNPDAPGSAVAGTAVDLPEKPVFLGMAGNEGFTGSSALRMGSNNWVTGPAMSANGRPVVANDPHLDARILPGPWYPVGLVTPGFKAVGANIAGLPGITVGRTGHLAFGSTNAYGDMQDLYVETVDPDNPENYLEGEDSIPFSIIEEKIRYKDEEADGGYGLKTLQVRKTRRGPVVSDIFEHLKTDKVLTLRFAPFETMHSRVGFDRFLTAASVSEAIEALREINMISLNLVCADTSGDFAWWVTGTLSERAAGGTFPYPVTGKEDNWRG
jgi:penicillin amidase